MLSFVSDGDPRPVHRQIRDQVLGELARGVARAGDPLPSARSLGGQLGINLHTVEKAYLALQADGVVVRDRRRRLLISPPVAASAEFRRDWDDRLRPLLAEGLARGLVKLEIGRRVGELLAEVPDSAPDGDSG